MYLLFSVIYFYSKVMVCTSLYVCLNVCMSVCMHEYVLLHLYLQNLCILIYTDFQIFIYVCMYVHENNNYCFWVCYLRIYIHIYVLSGWSVKIVRKECAMVMDGVHSFNGYRGEKKINKSLIEIII